MTDVLSHPPKTGSQYPYGPYGSLKRRASSPVDRSRVVSRRRIDPLIPAEEYLPNDEQRTLDNLTVKAIHAYRGTVFDPVHSLKAYIRVCDELAQGEAERMRMRRLMDEREELELLLDTQKEFSDRDLSIIRNSPFLRRKLAEKLPGKDKSSTPSRTLSMISPPLTSSQPSSSSPRPAPKNGSSLPMTQPMPPQPRIPTPLQLSASHPHQSSPHMSAYKTPAMIKREPDARLSQLHEPTLPRSYGPPPPGQSSFQLSPTPPRPSTIHHSPKQPTIPSVARPVEPEGPTRLTTAHPYSSSPYALKLDSAKPRSAGMPITAREALAATGQSPRPAQPSVLLSPSGPQPPLPQTSSNTWFIPYHVPGPTGPNPLTFDFPKGTIKYDCPWCDKTYTGANARSVWRRHAQEKHNLPTLLRKRSRWDTGDDDLEAIRPKSLEEKKERNLASKRQWAKDNRVKKKIQEQIERLPSNDAYRRILQSELENMSRKHRAWESEWAEELSEMPASDGEMDTEPDVVELSGPPSVIAQPEEEHPMSFRIPTGFGSSPAPVHHGPNHMWRTLSAGPPYHPSSLGHHIRHASLNSLSQEVCTHEMRKPSLGDESSYSGDTASPRDMESSEEDARWEENSASISKQGERDSSPPIKRRRRKPGEWVIKTGIDRCDLCQRRRVPECVVGPHKKACILCAKKKVQCGWSFSEHCHGIITLPFMPGFPHLHRPPGTQTREQELRDRAAPWPEPFRPRQAFGEVDMDLAYPNDEEPKERRESRPPINPVADRNTMLRLDEALPPQPTQLRVRTPSSGSTVRSNNMPRGDRNMQSGERDKEGRQIPYTGAARCNGCISGQLEDCFYERGICHACRDKGQKCEWTIVDKMRSPSVSLPPTRTSSVTSCSQSAPPPAADPIQTDQDRTSSVVLRQVVQLAEELRSDKVKDDEVLGLMARILRAKKGFRPGLVEWLEEDRALYKERLLLLIEEMQAKYVTREKGTLGDCMEADRRRRAEDSEALPAAVPVAPIKSPLPMPTTTPAPSQTPAKSPEELPIVPAKVDSPPPSPVETVDLPPAKAVTPTPTIPSSSVVTPLGSTDPLPPTTEPADEVLPAASTSEEGPIPSNPDIVVPPEAPTAE
ncbi:hypothetical protein DACRYDRAFT_102419 [Dacryopinax primogenitus]|uniref:Uncharacterized protein n=1 Tax=Dacryopinax primogenitus (strain DJM 731) TaxID=1858805 RepID=M5FNE4_DACPD|nr:uncharacterized protein DACRYDRAFT_102419 [Dacryopinax primogenitus]EJT97300.1 hypothetical protein DACRYDRAFT_102419 [Dacryopinax primogenitus]